MEDPNGGQRSKMLNCDSSGVEWYCGPWTSFPRRLCLPFPRGLPRITLGQSTGGELFLGGYLGNFKPGWGGLGVESLATATL